MTERQEEFRQILLEEKAKLMHNARRTLTEEMTVDVADLPDEMDLASSDSQQSLAFRLRGRERHLLSKVEQALERLEDDEYWWCTDCGAWIGFKRLRARPVTDLCILCKERREHKERGYAR
ncbi:MAG: TraR/DksA C4-type zinc finger protein [Myxococcales bacterium]|nr:TraR/DksA C4-type zinc finger protein [Myxococcales bacterium]